MAEKQVEASDFPSVCLLSQRCCGWSPKRAHAKARRPEVPLALVLSVLSCIHAMEHSHHGDHKNVDSDDSEHLANRGFT